MVAMRAAYVGRSYVTAEICDELQEEVIRGCQCVEQGVVHVVESPDGGFPS
jgi:hypothetical protein